MPLRSRTLTLIGLGCLLSLILPLLLYSAGGKSAPSAPVSEQPRLAVLVYFDQMRGDYPARWQSLYGEHGLRRLMTEGAWFTNCHYPYAITKTGPGHASVATGCSPSEHGIIENEWPDRETGEEIICAVHGRYERVPASPEPLTGRAKSLKAPRVNVSPELLIAPALGDAFKEATGGKGRVVALSLKERAAVLPAGRHPNVCCWFDEETGQFVTSTFYAQRLSSWVAAYNRGRPADIWFQHTWQRFRADLDYDRFSGPDDQIGEGKGFNQGRIFPHAMHGPQTAPNKSYYQAVFNSPYGNELLLDLALRALDAEDLGHGPAADFLSISFSSNDAVGHVWGPDSHEVLDVTLRSDALMARLLAHLDAHVGKGRYVLLLTADHGVCPLPEVAQQQGLGGGRISPKILAQNAAAFLDGKFDVRNHKDSWFAGKPDLWIYLNRKFLKAHVLNEAEVAAALAVWLKQQPGILTTYTRQQLLEGLPGDDVLGGMVQRSFYPQRSGDVAVILKPYYLLTEPLATGTTHGSPHPYDTHVPLLVYGPGIHAGIREDRVSPLAAASILARALKIEPPARAQAPVPEGLLQSP